jgi:hypothetical protein
MRGYRLYVGFAWVALGLAEVSSAQAGSSLAGRSGEVGQVTPVSTGIGLTGAGASSVQQNFNVYGTAGLANGLESATDNAVNITPTTLTPPNASPNSISLQSNIDSSRYINSSSNVTVNDTVNGSNVSYGGNGASLNWPQSNALNVIDGMASYNSGVSANSGPNMTAVNDALDVASFLQSQQDNGQ